jgi:hypothetical protein
MFAPYWVFSPILWIADDHPLALSRRNPHIGISFKRQDECAWHELSREGAGGSACHLQQTRWSAEIGRTEVRSDATNRPDGRRLAGVVDGDRRRAIPTPSPMAAWARAGTGTTDSETTPPICSEPLGTGLRARATVVCSAPREWERGRRERELAMASGGTR